MISTGSLSRKYIVGLITALTIYLMYSCAFKTTESNQFYLWKYNNRITESIKSIIKTENTQRLYVHFFDLDLVNLEGEIKPAPVYKIGHLDSFYTQFEITPVVFITNRCFTKSNMPVHELADSIHQLVLSISASLNITPLRKIQLDCDWTVSSFTQFDSLLLRLKKWYEPEATIRLHQIKYAAKTGVPSVNKGVLMLYNTGDFRNSYENSILQTNTVKQYISRTTKYPIELDVALPLFSQTIIKKSNGEYKIINGSKKPELLDKHAQFARINENLFIVKESCFFHSHYLKVGDQIKTEETLCDDVMESMAWLNKSQLSIQNKLFYHLDSSLISLVQNKKILEAL